MFQPRQCPIYRLTTQSEFIGGLQPGMADGGNWRTARRMQAQPSENTLGRRSDIAKLQFGTQIAHLRGERQHQRETFGRISREGGKQVSFRQCQHNRIGFGYGVAVIVRSRQGGFGETVACRRDMQNEWCAISQNSEKPDLSSLDQEHCYCGITLTEGGRAATDPMTVHPRWMHRRQQAAGEAIGRKDGHLGVHMIGIIGNLDGSG